jgi:hypothetical protein
MKKIRITPLNFLTLEWLTPLIFLGAKRPLQNEDLYELPAENSAETLACTMETFSNDLKDYQNGIKSKKPSLFSILFKKYGLMFCLAVFLQGLSVACALTVPTFLQQIIYFLTPNYPSSLLLIQSGIALSFILMALQIGVTLFLYTSSQLTNIIQVDIKTILIGAVYEKSLKLSQASSRKFTQGKILNLINVDIEKISLMFLQITQLIISPVQVTVSIILIFDYIQNSVWFGAGTLFGILFLQLFVIPLLVKFQKAFLGAGDKRLKSIREVLYGF